MPALTRESPLAHPGSFESDVWLAKHQLALLHRCQQVEKQYKFGILNDASGTGKSNVILAMIMADISQKCDGINVLVVPHNIVSQWMRYIQLFCTGKMLIVRLCEYLGLNELLRRPVEYLENLDIIVMTPLLHDVFSERFPLKAIKRVVIDEVDSIEWSLNRRITAEYTWLVSATCKNIPTPYDTALHAAAELGTLCCYCDPDFIQDSWKLPPPVYKQRICKSDYLDLFLDLLDAAQKQCANAGDFTWLSGSAKAIETDRDALVAYCANMNKRVDEQKAHVAFLKSELVKITQWLSTEAGGDVNQSAAALLRKRMMADGALNKPIFEQKLAESEKHIDETSEELKRVYDRMRCRHMCILCAGSCVCKAPCCESLMCRDCLDTWQRTCARSDCPYCFVRLKPGLLRDDDPCIVATPSPPGSMWPDKESALMHILSQRTESDKIIVFSDYTQKFDKLIASASRLGVRCHNLTGGGVKQIDTILDEFKKGHIQGLFANATLFGSGINLNETTDVVFLHRMDDVYESQVIGRAHRYPRHTSLRIWYLVYTHEAH